MKPSVFTSHPAIAAQGAGARAACWDRWTGKGTKGGFVQVDNSLTSAACRNGDRMGRPVVCLVCPLPSLHRALCENRAMMRAHQLN